jgi:hypothetical protein
VSVGQLAQQRANVAHAVRSVSRSLQSSSSATAFRSFLSASSSAVSAALRSFSTFSRARSSSAASVPARAQLIGEGGDVPQELLGGEVDRALAEHAHAGLGERLRV